MLKSDVLKETFVDFCRECDILNVYEYRYFILRDQDC